MKMLERIIEPKQPLEDSRKCFSNPDLVHLIIPLLVEQLLTLLVGMVDTLMISYAGEAAVSGVSLVDQLNNVFIFVFGAIASGGAVIASQYIGSKNQKKGVTASSQLLMITLVFSLISAAFLILFRVPLLHFLFGRVEASVMDAALTYLLISAFSFPMLAVFNSTAALFRSMNKAQIVMNVSIIMNIINVVGNAIGIFALHAGVAGVAVPTLISRTFAGLVLTVLLLDQRQTLYIRIKEVFAWDSEMLKRILHIAVPHGIENGLFNISKVLIYGIVALFGTVQIAANGVAQGFWSLGFLANNAISHAFVTVIGQCMGAGDIPAAEYYNRKLMRITYLASIVWGFLVILATPAVLTFYNLSPETRRLSLILVIMHNTGNAFLGPLAFPLSNGLRAAGDVRYTMFSAIFATAGCRVFFAYLFGLRMNMGVVGIVLAMICDWTVKALLIGFRWKSGKWTRFRVI